MAAAADVFVKRHNQPLKACRACPPLAKCSPPLGGGLRMSRLMARCSTEAYVSRVKSVRNEAWLARAGRKATSFRRCTTNARAELNWSNQHAGPDFVEAGCVCFRTQEKGLRGRRAIATVVGEQAMATLSQRVGGQKPRKILFYLREVGDGKWSRLIPPK